MAKEYRRGRVFINWSQNDATKTMVSVYSLRAQPSPTVSCPLRWEELQTQTGKGDPAPLQISPDDALRRVAQHGDLFREVVERQQQLTSI
jgi:bifunctional non-homologous end joining protein LigD